MEEKRTVTPVRVGNLTLGDGNVYIQSMLSVPSTDIEGNVQQAIMLEQAGCQILRVAIPDQAAVALIPGLKRRSLFRWWQIFILITGWRWIPCLLALIKSVSILDTLAQRKMSAK